MLVLVLVLVGCSARQSADELLAAALVRRLAPAATATVADIGAGSGAVAHAFAQALPGGHVIATELRANDLERLRDDARRRADRNLEVRQAALEESRLSDREVDLVVLCRVDHLLRERRPYLDALRRALRPDGRIVIANDLREEGAVVAVAVALGWQEVDRFEPSPKMFARVYRPPVAQAP